MEKFAAEAKTKGYPFSDGPHPNGRGGAIAFIDAPEGYEIELIQVGPGKSNCRVTSLAYQERSSLIAAHEIRFATRLPLRAGILVRGRAAAAGGSGSSHGGAGSQGAPSHSAASYAR